MRNLFLLVLILAFSSCQKEADNSLNYCDTSKVWFSADIRPIAESKCGAMSGSCHSRLSQEYNHSAFDFTYDNAASRSGLITLRVSLPRSDEHAMPIGGPGCTQCEIAIFRNWSRTGTHR